MFSIQVLNLLDLTHKSTLERLEALLYKLKWSQFSGVQMLLLKVPLTQYLSFFVEKILSEKLCTVQFWN